MGVSGEQVHQTRSGSLCPVGRLQPGGPEQNEGAVPAGAGTSRVLGGQRRGGREGVSQK